MWSLESELRTIPLKTNVEIITPSGKVKRFGDPKKAMAWAFEFMANTPAQGFNDHGKRLIVLYPYCER